ncbi:annexin D2-like isoform X2 [Macadamia integrifolia]|uniref:annexin D2-like isoform X2 n=1 Tax=Macadamia integrifolia TaxID=60698 RepID=UPI001C4E9039|nr:annexin D2-like isoform X2 [Macadamia integrifolia]
MDSSIQVSGSSEFCCRYLHSCFSGNRATDKRKLVEILTTRKLQELRLIRQTYNALYNQDVLQILSNAQRNNPFARVVYLRMSEPQTRDAEIVRSVLFGGNLDISTLIEIVCARPSLELQSIKQAYRSQYNSDIEQDFSLKIKGDFKEILLAVLKSCRHYGSKVEMSMAMCDAKTLYEAMESGKSLDQKTMISLLSQRSTYQLKAILVSYKQLYGHEFSKSLKRNKCGQFGKDLSVVIKCIQYPVKYFVKQLRRTLHNGDSREVLIRIVITRSGVDIKEINTAFAAKTGWSIESLIRNMCNNATDKAFGYIAEFLVGLLKYH